MQSIIAGLRIVAGTIVICVVGYVNVVLGIAQLVTPDTANGSLVTSADGAVIGSRLIAQNFTDPAYLWPRPSAAAYNGAGAGGSHKSPTSTDLTARAEELIARYDATPERPLPPELAAASGAGLDPHISDRAARYQAARVANARGVTHTRVESIIAERAFSPGGMLTSDRIVNVLELNLALDSLIGGRR